MVPANHRLSGSARFLVTGEPIAQIGIAGDCRLTSHASWLLKMFSAGRDGVTLGGMPTLYDEVLYPNAPFGQTHPDRLATLAILFGMDPAPINRCRVLELGCGDGENLIPMAFENPAAQFLGLDAAAMAIRAGKQEIATLGLANIRLEHMDIMDAGPELGTFDYVIAHGLYSWVPEPVRDKLLALAKAVLAPHGVAFVSYNALPGGRLRQMFRDMMLFHLGGATEFDARIHGRARGRAVVPGLPALRRRVGPSPSPGGVHHGAPAAGSLPRRVGRSLSSGVLPGVLPPTPRASGSSFFPRLTITTRSRESSPRPSWRKWTVWPAATASAATSTSIS